MKRLLSILLAVLLVLAVLPFSVFATEGEMSENFKTFLNEEGKFEINCYVPETEEELGLIIDGVLCEYGNASYGNLNIDDMVFDLTVYLDEDFIESETHTVEFKFNTPDPKMVELVKGYIEKLPKGAIDQLGYPEPYHFSVTDLEVFNYWLSCTGKDSDINSLLSFSDEFKEYIDYKNFVMNARMGWDGAFSTGASGDVDFKYKGFVCGMAILGASADHVIYVPDNTPNTKEALLKAAQDRIDTYLGQKGKVELAHFGTALDAIYQYNYDFEIKMEWIDSNTTLQEYIDNNPQYDEYFSEQVGLEGVEKTDDSFIASINGVNYYFIIKADSDKMVTPSYFNVDVVTDVEVSSSNGNIPLDTMLEVEEINKGEEYEKIINILDVKDNQTFDIKLHSSTSEKYITKTENGEFQVKIPVPAELKGKTLTVYYVNSNGKVDEHTVTPDGEYAVFTTDHFSIYTLAEAKRVTSDKEISPETNTTDKVIPPTKDSTNIALETFLAIVALAAVAFIRKHGWSR